MRREAFILTYRLLCTFLEDRKIFKIGCSQTFCVNSSMSEGEDHSPKRVGPILRTFQLFSEQLGSADHMQQHM